MADEQAASPGTDNPQAGGQGGGTTLTTQKTESTTPLAEGATKLQPAWMAQLPQDLKEDQSLTKFQTIGDLGKSYKELEGKLGKAIVLPGEKATDEEKVRYRKSIGVPDKPEDYKLDPVELPGGITKDEATEKAFLAKAHELNLTLDQVKNVHQWYYKQLADDMKVVKTTMAEVETAMAKEYGADWSQAKGFMERGFAQFADAETAKLFDLSGLGNHPGVIRMFIKMGKLITEHPFVDGKNERTESSPIGQRSNQELADVVYPAKQ